MNTLEFTPHAPTADGKFYVPSNASTNPRESLDVRPPSVIATIQPPPVNPENLKNDRFNFFASWRKSSAPEGLSSKEIKHTRPWHGNSIRHSINPLPSSAVTPPKPTHTVEGVKGTAYALMDGKIHVWDPKAEVKRPTKNDRVKRLAKGTFVVPGTKGVQVLKLGADKKLYALVKMPNKPLCLRMVNPDGSFRGVAKQMPETTRDFAISQGGHIAILDQHHPDQIGYWSPPTGPGSSDAEIDWRDVTQPSEAAETTFQWTGIDKKEPPKAGQEITACHTEKPQILSLAFGNDDFLHILERGDKDKDGAYPNPEVYIHKKVYDPDNSVSEWKWISEFSHLSTNDGVGKAGGNQLTRLITLSDGRVGAVDTEGNTLTLGHTGWERATPSPIDMFYNQFRFETGPRRFTQLFGLSFPIPFGADNSRVDKPRWKPSMFHRPVDGQALLDRHRNWRKSAANAFANVFRKDGEKTKALLNKVKGDFKKLSFTNIAKLNSALRNPSKPWHSEHVKIAEAELVEPVAASALKILETLAGNLGIDKADDDRPHSKAFRRAYAPDSMVNSYDNVLYRALQVCDVILEWGKEHQKRENEETGKELPPPELEKMHDVRKKLQALLNKNVFLAPDTKRHMVTFPGKMPTIVKNQHGTPTGKLLNDLAGLVDALQAGNWHGIPDTDPPLAKAPLVKEIKTDFEKLSFTNIAELNNTLKDTLRDPTKPWRSEHVKIAEAELIGPAADSALETIETLAGNLGFDEADDVRAQSKAFRRAYAPDSKVNSYDNVLYRALVVCDVIIEWGKEHQKREKEETGEELPHPELVQMHLVRETLKTLLEKNVFLAPDTKRHMVTFPGKLPTVVKNQHATLTGKLLNDLAGLVDALQARNWHDMPDTDPLGAKNPDEMSEKTLYGQESEEEAASDDESIGKHKESKTETALKKFASERFDEINSGDISVFAKFPSMANLDRVNMFLSAMSQVQNGFLNMHKSQLGRATTGEGALLPTVIGKNIKIPDGDNENELMKFRKQVAEAYVKIIYSMDVGESLTLKTGVGGGLDMDGLAIVFKTAEKVSMLTFNKIPNVQPTSTAALNGASALTISKVPMPHADTGEEAQGLSISVAKTRGIDFKPISVKIMQGVGLAGGSLNEGRTAVFLYAGVEYLPHAGVVHDREHAATFNFAPDNHQNIRHLIMDLFTGELDGVELAKRASTVETARSLSTKAKVALDVQGLVATGAVVSMDGMTFLHNFKGILAGLVQKNVTGELTKTTKKVLGPHGDGTETFSLQVNTSGTVNGIIISELQIEDKLDLPNVPAQGGETVIGGVENQNKWPTGIFVWNRPLWDKMLKNSNFTMRTNKEDGTITGVSLSIDAQRKHVKALSNTIAVGDHPASGGRLPQLRKFLKYRPDLKEHVNLMLNSDAPISIGMEFTPTAMRNLEKFRSDELSGSNSDEASRKLKEEISRMIQDNPNNLRITSLSISGNNTYMTGASAGLTLFRFAPTAVNVRNRSVAAINIAYSDPAEGEKSDANKESTDDSKPLDTDDTDHKPSDVTIMGEGLPKPIPNFQHLDRIARDYVGLEGLIEKEELAWLAALPSDSAELVEDKSKGSHAWFIDGEPEKGQVGLQHGQLVYRSKEGNVVLPPPDIAAGLVDKIGVRLLWAMNQGWTGGINEAALYLDWGQVLLSQEQTNELEKMAPNSEPPKIAPRKAGDRAPGTDTVNIGDLVHHLRNNTIPVPEAMDPAQWHVLGRFFPLDDQVAQTLKELYHRDRDVDDLDDEKVRALSALFTPPTDEQTGVTPGGDAGSKDMNVPPGSKAKAEDIPIEVVITPPPDEQTGVTPGGKTASKVTNVPTGSQAKPEDILGKVVNEGVSEKDLPWTRTEQETLQSAFQLNRRTQRAALTSRLSAMPSEVRELLRDFNEGKIIIDDAEKLSVTLTGAERRDLMDYFYPTKLRAAVAKELEMPPKEIDGDAKEILAKFEKKLEKIDGGAAEILDRLNKTLVGDLEYAREVIKATDPGGEGAKERIEKAVKKELKTTLKACVEGLTSAEKNILEDALYPAEVDTALKAAVEKALGRRLTDVPGPVVDILVERPTKPLKAIQDLPANQKSELKSYYFPEVDANLISNEELVEAIEGRHIARNVARYWDSQVNLDKRMVRYVLNTDSGKARLAGMVSSGLDLAKLAKVLNDPVLIVTFTNELKRLADSYSSPESPSVSPKLVPLKNGGSFNELFDDLEETGEPKKITEALEDESDDDDLFVSKSKKSNQKNKGIDLTGFPPPEGQSIPGFKRWPKTGPFEWHMVNSDALCLGESLIQMLQNRAVGKIPSKKAWREFVTTVDNEEKNKTQKQAPASPGPSSSKAKGKATEITPKGQWGAEIHHAVEYGRRNPEFGLTFVQTILPPRLVREAGYVFDAAHAGFVRYLGGQEHGSRGHMVTYLRNLGPDDADGTWWRLDSLSKIQEQIGPSLTKHFMTTKVSDDDGLFLCMEQIQHETKGENPIAVLHRLWNDTTYENCSMALTHAAGLESPWFFAYARAQTPNEEGQFLAEESIVCIHDFIADEVDGADLDYKKIVDVVTPDKEIRIQNMAARIAEVLNRRDGGSAIVRFPENGDNNIVYISRDGGTLKVTLKTGETRTLNQFLEQREDDLWKRMVNIEKNSNKGEVDRKEIRDARASFEAVVLSKSTADALGSALFRADQRNLEKWNPFKTLDSADARQVPPAPAKTKKSDTPIVDKSKFSSLDAKDKERLDKVAPEKNMDPGRITVVKGNFVRFEGGAIVNPANSGLQGGEGADGAVYEAAGRDRLRKYMGERYPDGIGTRKAVVSPGMDLPAKKIIHLVVPNLGTRAIPTEKEKQDYRDAVTEAIDEFAKEVEKEKAKGNIIEKTMGFSIPGVGAFGWKPEDAAKELIAGCIAAKKNDIAITLIPWHKDSKVASIVKQLEANGAVKSMPSSSPPKKLTSMSTGAHKADDNLKSSSSKKFGSTLALLTKTSKAWLNKLTKTSETVESEPTVEEPTDIPTLPEPPLSSVPKIDLPNDFSSRDWSEWAAQVALEDWIKVKEKKPEPPPKE